MARVNYGGDKRRKELQRLAKQEEKRQRKLERKQARARGESAPPEDGDAEA
ncbi:MAG TPA: hypothetical protein PKM88_08380 [bacterium]|nr:hypothetical protein [bacterium]